MCRALLMHVAVEAGAKPSATFIEYVGHLAASDVISPPMRSWTDQIRKNANKAIHELDAVTEDRARQTLVFAEMLLTVHYEMRHRLAGSAPPPKPSGSP
jgi:hypothetical protein